MVGMNLGHRDAAIGAKPFGDVNHRRRHVEMEGVTQSAEWNPFGERLEIVNGFDGFHLDDSLDLPATVGRRQHHVWIDRRGPGANRRVLLGTWVDTHIETTAKPGLQKADDAVVFELLADRPDEDGAHEIATITWISLRRSPLCRNLEP